MATSWGEVRRSTHDGSGRARWTELEAPLRILDLSAHSIDEYDHVRLYTELGHEVFSPGAYVDPKHPGDDMRPAIMSDLADHPDLLEILGRVPVSDDKPDVLWNAKDDLPDEWLDWTDIVLCRHIEWRWLWPQ